MRRARSAPALTAEHRFRGQKGFFSPVFSFMPPLMGALRTFKLWPGGAQATGPINAARSYAGMTVTPELALSLSVAWACIWRYANTICSLPLMTMQTGEKNTATVAGKHELYSLLHDRPNINMSAASFWKSQVASMMSWGFAISEKQYVGSRLVALDPWRPEYVTTYLKDGRLRYRYNPAPGIPNPGPKDVSAEEVFVVLDRTMDGYTALSRIQYGANSFAHALSAERAAGLAWKNGLRATGILTIAAWLKPDQREQYKRIVNEFVGVGDDTTTGVDAKQYGVMVAENATKFETLSLKPQDLELLDSRRFSVEDLCRWYDMPPILIGHASEGQTMWGSGIEQIILGWFKMGLFPVTRTIEQEIHRQLVKPEEKEGIFAEFNFDAFLRGDSTSRANFISTMVQNGIYTRDEVRARENLPPVEGGDQATVQSNLVPLDKLGELAAQPAPPASADEVKQIIEQVFRTRV